MKLGQYIFSDNIYVYAILDGAAIPDLLERFYEMRPPHVCLYRGELDLDLQEVAPYLVNLQPGARFTNWLLSECEGKNWGIFLHSPFMLPELRKHFRRFLTVHDERGNPMIFRYYDPRVLPKFLPTCRAEELGLFFEKVKTYFAETRGGDGLIKMQYASGELKQLNLELREAPGDVPAGVIVPQAFQSNQFSEPARYA
jgi:hypothetical protein